MKSQTIETKTIFDAGAVAVLVQTASQFKSLITLNIDRKTANAKSIMGLLSLGLTEGQRVLVNAEGEDEEQAATKVGEFLGSMSCKY